MAKLDPNSPLWLERLIAHERAAAETAGGKPDEDGLLAKPEDDIFTLLFFIRTVVIDHAELDVWVDTVRADDGQTLFQLNIIDPNGQVRGLTYRIPPEWAPRFTKKAALKTRAAWSDDDAARQADAMRQGFHSKAARAALKETTVLTDEEDDDDGERAKVAKLE